MLDPRTIISQAAQWFSLLCGATIRVVKLFVLQWQSDRSKPCVCTLLNTISNVKVARQNAAASLRLAPIGNLMLLSEHYCKIQLLLSVPTPKYLCQGLLNICDFSE